MTKKGNRNDEGRHLHKITAADFHGAKQKMVAGKQFPGSEKIAASARWCRAQAFFPRSLNKRQWYLFPK